MLLEYYNYTTQCNITKFGSRFRQQDCRISRNPYLVTSNNNNNKICRKTRAYQLTVVCRLDIMQSNDRCLSERTPASLLSAITQFGFDTQCVQQFRVLFADYRGAVPNVANPWLFVSGRVTIPGPRDTLTHRQCLLGTLPQLQDVYVNTDTYLHTVHESRCEYLMYHYFAIINCREYLYRLCCA